MYYPSRIQQLVTEDKPELQTISELSQYYKELYSILSFQAMAQINTVKIVAIKHNIKDVIGLFGRFNNEKSLPCIVGDIDLLKLIFEILYRKNNSSTLIIDTDQKSEQYLTLHIQMDHLSLSKEECKELFSPHAKGLDFFICRQIVREYGEINNKRGCGISATNESNRVVIHITLSIYERRKGIS